MPLTEFATSYRLAATAYTETTTLLFLHVLAAMTTMAGVLGMLVLYLRARSAGDVNELHTTVALLGVFGQRVLQPAAGLTGVLGIVLAWRFDVRGLFSLSHQGWLLVALVLWVLQSIIAARAVGAAVAAIEPVSSPSELAEAKARLRSVTVSAPVWLTLVVTIAIVYLMIFRPFIRS